MISIKIQAWLCEIQAHVFSKVDLCRCLLVSEYQSDLCNVVGFISEPRGFIVHCILDFDSKYLRVRHIQLCVEISFQDSAFFKFASRPSGSLSFLLDVCYSRLSTLPLAFGIVFWKVLFFGVQVAPPFKVGALMGEVLLEILCPWTWKVTEKNEICQILNIKALQHRVRSSRNAHPVLSKRLDRTKQNIQLEEPSIRLALWFANVMRNKTCPNFRSTLSTCTQYSNEWRSERACISEFVQFQKISAKTRKRKSQRWNIPEKPFNSKPQNNYQIFFHLFFRISPDVLNEKTETVCHSSTHACKNAAKVKAVFCWNEFLLCKMSKSAARLLRQPIHDFYCGMQNTSTVKLLYPGKDATTTRKKPLRCDCF